MSRAAWCALFLSLFATAAVSCRDLYVCGGSPLCDAAAGGGGGGAGAGVGGRGSAGDVAQAGDFSSNGGSIEVAPGGAAGEGGALACESPLANCDQTRLNGCEADLSGDVNDCGRCGSLCNGVCARSSCHVPQSLVEQAIQPLTPFAQTSDSLYFEWGAPSGPYHLSRVDKLGGTPQLVADKLPAFSQIAAGPDRVYLWAPAENLHSVTFAGKVVDEGIEVSAIAVQGDVVFAASKGMLLERKSPTASWQPVPGFSSVGSDSQLWPVDVDGSLVVVRVTGVDTAPHYEVLLLEMPDVVGSPVDVLASGSGLPVRVRSSTHYVYWLVQTGANETGLFELHRHEPLVDTPEQFVAREFSVDDFALDDGFVYLTRSLNPGHELELVLVESIGEKLHLGSRFDLVYPEPVGDYLWFFDTSLQRLRRVDLGFGQFL